MVNAPLDRELAEAVELLALGGREPVAVVARDERALLHAEVDGVAVHHEPVARVPAEVAVRAGLRVAVLKFGCDVEEHVELVEADVRAKEVVGAREQPNARQRAVAPLGLLHEAAERPLGARAHGVRHRPRFEERSRNGKERNR